MLPVVFRFTTTDLDDKIIRLVEVPVLVIGAGVAYWQFLIVPSWWSSNLDDLNWPVRLLITTTAFYLVYRLIKDVLGGLLDRRAQNTQGTTDDVVTPILIGQIVPTVLIVLAVLTSFWVFGGSIAAGIATAGGLSFLLVYLLQDPLSNLFGGLALALDVPFGYGDLITLEDGKTYAVQNIGSRVTHLYDIAEHNSVYIPNVILTQQRLINLFLPNAELRQHITIGVAYETDDLGLVADLLTEAANRHPNVLGQWEEKEALLKAAANEQRDAAADEGKDQQARSEARAEALVIELEIHRLEAETEVRKHSEAMLRYARIAADDMARMEQRGLDQLELDEATRAVNGLHDQFEILRSDLSEWVFVRGLLLLRYTLKATEGLLPPTVDALEHASKRFVACWQEDLESQASRLGSGFESGKLAAIGDVPLDLELPIVREHFATLTAPWAAAALERATKDGSATFYYPVTDTWLDSFSTWGAYQSFAKFYRSWHKPVFDIAAILERVDKGLDDERRKPGQLHRDLNEIVDLIERKMPLRVDAHRKPDADLASFGASSIDFELDFFVDDVAGDYYERVGDVRGDVLSYIWDLFIQHGIEIPYNKIDVSFSNNAPTSAE
ncbi:MAG: mechanosensitive ion channel domain-containing protein [Acidimicrobiales bacterium]